MNLVTKKDFEKRFGAMVEPGTRRFHRAMRIDNYGAFEMDYKVEDVPSLTIHITEDEFEHLVRYVPNSEREVQMREEIPAVRKAWDNYQLLLKMCSGDYR